jgi:hypothetical protein
MRARFLLIGIVFSSCVHGYLQQHHAHYTTNEETVLQLFHQKDNLQTTTNFKLNALLLWHFPKCRAAIKKHARDVLSPAIDSIFSQPDLHRRLRVSQEEALVLNNNRRATANVNPKIRVPVCLNDCSSHSDGICDGKVDDYVL